LSDNDHSRDGPWAIGPKANVRSPEAGACYGALLSMTGRCPLWVKSRHIALVSNAECLSGTNRTDFCYRLGLDEWCHTKWREQQRGSPWLAEARQSCSIRDLLGFTRNGAILPTRFCVSLSASS